MKQSRHSSPPPGPPRRRSPPQPPQDTRRTGLPGPSAGIQIRGLAQEREELRDRRDYHPAPDRRDHPRDNGHHDEELRRDVKRRRSSSHSRSRSRSRSRRTRQYRDWDRPAHRSPGRYSRSRSPSPRRRARSPSFGGPPSREIILDGLPSDMTEDDVPHPPLHAFHKNPKSSYMMIKTELRAYRAENLEDVRIIRNRSTGASRQFGFVRFPSIHEAKSFLEQNYPIIHLYGSDSRDTQAKPVRVAFSRERGDRDKDRDRNRGGPRSDHDWTCGNCSILNYSRRVECIRCKLPKQEVEKIDEEQPEDAEIFANTGDSDVSPDSTPSQFLLFRSLEPSVTEEILAKGAMKLLRTDEDALSNPQAKPAGPKIVSTSTVAHAGARPECIRRVFLVRDRRTNESWRYGFVEFAAVEDAQAALAKFNSLEKFTIASKPIMVSYIHAGVFVPVLKPPRDPRFNFAASNNASLKLAYWDQDAYVNISVISETEPHGSSQINTSEKASSATPKAISKPSKEADAKLKKRKAEAGTPAASTKKMASHLQFWTDRHNELHGIDSNTSEAETEGRASTPTPSNRNTDASTNPGAVANPAGAPTELHQRSYADPDRHCCYLCSRQFKTAAEVNKHERLSELHQKNLQEPDLVDKAMARLTKAGVPLGTSSSSEYRDRAKERRQAFNQPKQPGFSPSKAAEAKTGSSAAAPVAEHAEDKEKQKSKGASMLASMGYVAGQGLGAGGTGIQAPIAQDLYREGVGLGAEGGRVGDAVEEAGRATRGDYNEFAEKTREKARERFGKLD